jgi:methylenetetrahydrofolate reductase (NADPH)
MADIPPHRWSLEVVPAHASRASVARGLVDEVFVTMIPGSEIKAVLAAVETLAGLGFTPVPHIAAREFRSETELGGFLGAFRGLGVRKALLLAGGARQPAGPFVETLDVLRSTAFEGSGLREVGIAGHPEGNPDDPDSRQNLARKLEFLHAAGIRVEIVTQWSFFPEHVSDYIADLRATGVTETVAVGVAGPASLQTLLKYAKTCGVNAASEVLRKQGFSLGRLLVSNKPEAFVGAVKGTSRFHLYPFGGLEKCAQWLQAHRSAADGK